MTTNTTMASDTEIKQLNPDLANKLDEAEVEMDMEEEQVEEDYSDPKSIVPPTSLKELISRLHKIFADDDINIDYVKTLMESYTSDPKEWKKFAKFDPHR
ncbi:hypothetical protein V1264_024685 [Littorina saxatilis]|uniref:Cysteine dioxygenase n=1 Tax=Littorina saxatilis TaxID=31220 RepID=A0AAN9ALH9_9CAEN